MIAGVGRTGVVVIACFRGVNTGDGSRIAGVGGAGIAVIAIDHAAIELESGCARPGCPPAATTQGSRLRYL